MGGVINTITAGTIKYKLASTAYAICSTAEGTAAKIATIYDPTATSTATQFSLMDGVTVQVLFQNTNTAASPTLNINSTGAIPIYTTANTPAGNTTSTSWSANSIISLTCTNRTNYNGYVWLISSSNGRVTAIDNNTDKLYLLGTPSQNNSAIYSKQYIYAGADGYLYSNNHKVVTEDEIGTAAYINVDTEIDTSIVSNNVPTSGAVVNLVSNGLTNVKQQIESDVQLENTQYGVLLSNSYEDETNIGSVIKSDKLKYDFNQSTLYLSNIDENNSSNTQIFNLKPNELTFQSGVVTQVQIPPEEEGEDPTIEQNYDNFYSQNIFGQNGVSLKEKVEDLTNNTYQIIESNITGGSASLGGNLQVSGISIFSNNTYALRNFNAVGTTTLNETTILEPFISRSGNNIFQTNNNNNSFFIGETDSDRIGQVRNSIVGFNVTGNNNSQYYSYMTPEFLQLRQFENDGNGNYSNTNYTNTLHSDYISLIEYANNQYASQGRLSSTQFLLRKDLTTPGTLNTAQNSITLSFDSSSKPYVGLKYNGGDTKYVTPTNIDHWNNTYTTVNTNTSHWNDAYTVTNTIKSSWNTYTSNATVTINADAYGAYTHSKSLAPGTWLLFGGCRYPGRSTGGFIEILFATSSSTSSADTLNSIIKNQSVFSEANNYLQLIGLINLSNTQTVYLKSRTSVKASCTFLYFKAIRLY